MADGRDRELGARSAHSSCRDTVQEDPGPGRGASGSGSAVLCGPIRDMGAAKRQTHPLNPGQSQPGQNPRGAEVTKNNLFLKESGKRHLKSNKSIGLRSGV
jgi:hypothetical protein